MSVQTELTRISTAKTNIKNVVNSSTANTITNQKLDAFPPLINGTIAAQKGYIPWIKGEGKYLTLKNSKFGGLDKFEMYGNTEQNQYNGKNLFNIDAVTDVTNGSINANKIIITNAGTSTNYNVAPTFSTKTLYSGKTYYLSADIRRVSGEGTFGKMNDYVADWTAVTTPTLSTSYQRYTYKKTFSSDTNYYRILIQFRNTNNGVFEIKNIQISEVDNVYEPYCGGVAAPNPDYPQEVKVVNGTQNINIAKKNLFDKNNQNFKQYYILNDDGEEITSNASQYSLAFTKVKPNTIYTIQGELCSSLNVTRIYEYDINKKWIKKSSGIGINSIPYTFTTSSNTYFLRFQVEMAAYNGDTVQLEEGSTATTYEPYQNQDYEINLKSKNLLPFPYTQSTITHNGVTFTVNNDGSVLVNGTASENENANIKLYGNYQEINQKPFTGKYLSGGTNVVRLRAFNNTGNNYTVLGNDTGSGAEIDTTTYTKGYIELTVLKGTTADNVLVKPMVLDSLDDTIYETYYDYELCKVRDYKDEIKKASEKNLLNIVNYDFAYIASNGNYNTDASHKNALFIDYIEVKPNTNYTASLNKNVNNFAISEYNSSKTFIQRTQFAYNVSNGTITTTANTKYLLISFNYDNSTAVNEGIINSLQFQLEEGDQTTTYEPYKNSWYIKKNINKTILNGSESWSLQQTSTDTLRFTAGNALTNGSTLNVMKIISDKFVNGTGTSDNSDNEHIRSATTGYANTISISINKNRLTENTNAAFKTWLSNNPITVYYIVENPEYLIITNETLINQLNAIETFEGINNISIENENNVLPDLLMITKNKNSYNNWKTKEGLN